MRPLALLLSVLSLLLLVAPAHAAAVVLGEQDIILRSNEDNTRVAVRFSDGVNVRVVDLLDTRGFFFVDLYNVRPGFDARRTFDVGDATLRRIQTIWYPDQNVLRMVFQPVNRTNFRVIDLNTGLEIPTSPLDVSQYNPAEQARTRYVLIDTARDPDTPLPSAKGLVRDAVVGPAQTPGTGNLTKRLVVLDPGHGGKSMGAVSRVSVGGKKLAEKDVVLAIAKEVKRLLNKTPVATAVMSREGDHYISLADRVDFAERLEADLFVSIHANAARYHKKNNAPRGVEFYYLSPNSNPEVRELEMAENEEPPQLDTRSSEQLELITRNMAKDIVDELRAESSEVAGAMDQIFRKDTYYAAHNRGVKSAAFKVLRNQVCPAVLVEVGFIDHDREVRNLANPDFQKRIAKLIANGILEYISILDERIQRYQYQMAY